MVGRADARGSDGGRCKVSQYDVIIVGAGPAGLLTAVNLNETLRVLVVESRRFPPSKPCGQVLIDQGYETLSRYDPPQALFGPIGRLGLRFITRDIDAPARLVGMGRTLDRKALAFWVDDMLGPNVDLVDGLRFVTAEQTDEGTRVVVRDGHGHVEVLTTGVLVGADGCLSRVRRSIVGDTLPAVDAIQHTYAAAAAPETADFIFDVRLARDYYAWVFPRGNGRILVGCPKDGRHFETVMEWARDEYGTQGPPLLAERHPVAKIGSLDDVDLGRNRVLLTGEAAGFVSPASGEGLSHAFASGEAAARAINEDPVAPGRVYRELCGPFYDFLAQELDLAMRMRNRPVNR